MLQHPRIKFAKYFRMREILTPEEAEAARKRALAEKENAHLYEDMRAMLAPYFEKMRAKRRRTAKPLWQQKSMGGK